MHGVTSSTSVRSVDYHPRRLTREQDTRVIPCVSFPPRSRSVAVLHGDTPGTVHAVLPCDLV